MFGKKKQQSNSPLQVEESYDAELVGLNTLKHAAGRTRLWRILIIICIVGSLWAAFVAMRLFSVARENGKLVEQALAQTSSEVPGKQAALNAVSQWLTDNTTTPYPDGIANLTWDRGKKTQTIPEKSDTQPEENYYVHYFSFTDLGKQKTQRVAQTVIVAGDKITTVGVPSILSDSQVTSSDGTAALPDGYASVEKSDSLQPMIESWAKAYAGKSVDALTVLVGDKNSAHVYQPARLGDYKNSAVNWVAYANEDGSATKDKTVKYAVGSVTISFTARKTKKPAATNTDANANATNSDAQQASTTTLSVLIENPNSGDAHITAWGAEGDFASLRSYTQFTLKSTRQAASQGADNDSDSGSGSSSGSGSGSDGDSQSDNQDSTTDNSNQNTDTDQQSGE